MYRYDIDISIHFIILGRGFFARFSRVYVKPPQWEFDWITPEHAGHVIIDFEPSIHISRRRKKNNEC